MMDTKYNIGDEVFWPYWGSKEMSIECPDCGGTGRIRLIMHDNSEHSIECGRCSYGYYPPTGRIKFWRWLADIKRGEITGLEISKGVVSYKISCGEGYTHIVKEEMVYTSEEDALGRAEILVEEHEKEELEKIAKKEKDTKSWAWNASYHRREIKSAERSIAYHAAKLKAANLKSKEPRNE